MRNAKFGVLVHYLEKNQNEQQPWNMGKKTSWDSCVNDFDVNLFAEQMHEIGAGYVIFTIYQGSKYMCIPNETYEKMTGYARGEATSNRDLVADLYDALKVYHIKLMLYVTGDGTYNDAHSYKVFQSPMMNWVKNGNKFIVTQAWVDNWSKVLEDMSLRYGKKISGWWVDGSSGPLHGGHAYNDTLLAGLYQALKAGNTESAVGFNPSPQPKVIYFSKWDDYTAGEMYPLTDLPPAGSDGKINGIQWQITSFIGTSWLNPDIRFTKEYLVNYLDRCKALGGAVTLDACVLRNGSIAPAQLAFLKQVSAAMKPVEKQKFPE